MRGDFDDRLAGETGFVIAGPFFEADERGRPLLATPDIAQLVGAVAV